MVLRKFSSILGPGCSTGLDNVNQSINRYPADKMCSNFYRLGSDLSSGKSYPIFEQRGPDRKVCCYLLRSFLHQVNQLQTVGHEHHFNRRSSLIKLRTELKSFYRGTVVLNDPQPKVSTTQKEEILKILLFALSNVLKAHFRFERITCIKREKKLLHDKKKRLWNFLN